MIEVHDLDGFQHDSSARNSARYAEPHNGTVIVSDARGVYIITTNEAERCLALEPPQEFEQEHFYTGRRQAELYNAELAARQGDWEREIWGAGMVDAPSPWKSIGY